MTGATFAALLTTLQECRTELDAHAGEMPLGGRSLLGELRPALSVTTADDAVGITVQVLTVWHPEHRPESSDDFDHRVTLWVSGSGCRVTSFLGGRLDIAVGGHGSGRAVLHEQTSVTTSLEEALPVLKAHVAAFGSLPAPVGSEPAALTERPAARTVSVVRADPIGRADPISRAEPVAAPSGAGRGPERGVAGLLKVVEHCRRELERTAQSLVDADGVEGPGRTLTFSSIVVERERGPLRLEARAEVRLLPDRDDGGDRGDRGDDDIDQVLLSIAAGVTDRGLVVTAAVEAWLDRARGTCPAGDHTFYERHLEVATAEEATAAALDQAAAVRDLADYRVALNLPRG